MKRNIRYTIIFLFVLASIVSFLFVNLGKYLDVSQKSVPSDVIVCLDGGDGHRASKALELYRKGYSSSGKILLTVSSSFKSKPPPASYYYNDYLLKNNILPGNIIRIKNAHNTVEELVAIRNYLLANNLKSALIVSAPPSTRRMIFIAKHIVTFDMYGLSVRMIGSDTLWWNREYFYKNKYATNYAILEVIKLLYNYIRVKTT